MPTIGKLFISYRRSQLDVVCPVVDALRHIGVDVFFDQDAIDPLASFPEKIRQGIAASHALLAWWSLDYGESDHCLAEYRLAWSHARRHSADVAQRLWVLNPEANAEHISAGEANASNFLRPPKAGEERAWAERLRDKLQALLPCGLLNDERQLSPEPVRYPNPFPQGNDHFTGRNRELMRIHSLLHPPRIGGQASNVALHAHGLGGIGKTELALQYADQFQAAYPGGVYWLNLAGFDPARFSAADRIEDNAKHAWAHAVHSALGEQIGLTVNEENKPFPADVLRQKLVEHFAERQDFLWIVDNVPPIQPADRRERILAYWQAPAAQGRTLITSRDPLPLAGYAPLALERLSHEDSQRLLAQYRSPRTEAEKRACAEIASQLGGHPLALTLAGHALDCVHGNSERPYADLLHELTTRAAVSTLEDLAERMRPELGDKASGILASIDLSVRTLSEAAWCLLKLAATCASNLPIPKALLALAYHPDDPSRTPTRELLRAGLLQALSDDTRVRMHPLVAEASFALLMVTTEERETLQEEMARALLARLQDEEAQHASISREDDAELARELVKNLKGEIASNLRFDIAIFYKKCGLFTLARSMLDQMEIEDEKGLGPSIFIKFLSRMGRACIRKEEGKLAAACKIEEELLAEIEPKLGSSDPLVIIIKNNLAETHSLLENGTRALTLMGQVEHANNQGSDGLIDNIRIMHNKSRICADHGMLSEALELEAEALFLCLERFGNKHSKTLLLASGLSDIQWKLNEKLVAHDNMEGVVAIWREIARPGDLYLMDAINNLARMKVDLGKDAAAEELLFEIHSHAEKLFGPNAFRTKIYAENLAVARQKKAQNPSPVILSPKEPSPLLTVNPAAHFHPTGLDITPGAHYRFVASGQWQDGFKRAGPQGWRMPLMERFNRLPGQPFFLLCGCVGRELAQAFAIGTGLADWQAPAALAEQADRQLYLFANDWAWMYWNNHALGPEHGGPLSVQITRLS